MAIELVTGKKGTVHVDSADDGALYAAIAGKGEYVLDLDDRLACTMTTANKAHVASGHGLMQGRHWLVDAEGVDLTIQNGTQGQKRNDLIVARYECDAKNGNVESVALKVIKGTPTTGTPADPACTRGDILEGAALVNEQPLWRIPLNGITVGTPIQMFDVLTPAKEAWDSVAPVDLGGHWSMLQLPDNCAIFTFWDSFTLLKAGENIKTIELPRRVESCLYAGIARRTGGWSAKDAYINKTTYDSVELVAWPDAESSIGLHFDYQLVWIGKLS